MREGEIWAGLGNSWGKGEGDKLREIASARAFWRPSMCSADTAMLKWAQEKYRQRSRRLMGDILPDRS